MKQRDALNIHYTFHLQGAVPLTAGTKSFRPPPWTGRSRIQQRKTDQGGTFPKSHTHSEVNFGGLAQIKRHPAFRIPLGDHHLLPLREIPFEAVLPWAPKASVTRLPPRSATTPGHACGQRQAAQHAAHLKPQLPSQGRMRAAAPAERLGKVQPCCFMSTFLPLCLSQGLRQKILFCSYQFKQEQWIPQARKNVTRCQQSQPGRWCMVYRLQLK